VLTVDTPWDTIPDATSRFIIEEPTWRPGLPSKQSSAVLTTSPAPVVSTFSIDNYREQAILVQPLVADPSGATSLARFSPIRELYIWGAQGTRTITTSQTMLVTDSQVVADATAGAVVYTCLAFAAIPNHTFTVAKSDTSANTVTIALQAGDSFDDGTTAVVLSLQGDSFTFRVHG